MRKLDTFLLEVIGECKGEGGAERELAASSEPAGRGTAKLCSDPVLLIPPPLEADVTVFNILLMQILFLV